MTTQTSELPFTRRTPWQGKATTTDLMLVAAVVAVVGIGMAIRPLKPFLLATQPVLLEFLTGDKIAIGAAAAIARIGDVPLWLVVVAGAVGMVKFDWITWWAGRQWGAGIVGMFATSERVRRRAAELNPWTVRVAIVLAGLPGIPSAVVFAVAGWTGVRLRTFLLLDLVGAVLTTAAVAGLGYALGQDAVDAVLLVDKYAMYVSLAMVATGIALPLVRRWLRR
ncbi:DedA family protein [Pseudonocardia sp. CA-107938]|uniref:DedA family protein n=1 Tax=Pseudonocardia sp. CA-107938 TaxID=3240021 RepID=UPI003D8E818C